MKNRFSLSESGNLYLFALIAMSLVSLIVSLIPSKIYFGGLSLSNWLGYGLIQVAILSTVFVYSKLRKTDFLSAVSLKRKPNVKQLILTPFITVSCLIAFLPLSTCFANLLNLIGYKGGVSLPTSPDAAPYIVGLLIIALLPAIGEETLMRGGVLNGLNGKSVFFGIFISAFLFSFMHSNPLQTVYQFCFGVVLAVCAVYSGNIICTILMHFLNNLISLTITTFAPNFLSFDFGGFNYLIYLAMFIVGMMLLTLFMLIFYKVTGKEKQNSASLEIDDYTFTFTDSEVKKENFFVTYFKCLVGIFTKRGWLRFKSTLNDFVDYAGVETEKNQALSVYIAIGFVSIWWIVNFILGVV